ncbi:MAPEG family protein [Aquicoccus sp.]|uniref:MAPEG family protein n=2 Tax=Aquicoccus sp. TaxID=2055851 RepID=UPI003567B302
MSLRMKIVLGQAIGFLLAVVLVWVPLSMSPPFLPLNTALILAFLPGGLVALVMVGVVALRRFFDADVIAGGALRTGSTAEIDQRVLSNTIEQLVVALALWPFAALVLGGFVVIWMGVVFALARLVFWTGYHVSPLVKSIGFAAGFYPTVLSTLWTVVKWAM